jgi:ubiquinone/menaquinone biosynthesis C-methylase UbiE
LEPAEYDYMFDLEDAYWWYVGMRRIVERLMKRGLGDGTRPLQILDAGAGTGGSLHLLKRYGEVTAFDFARPAAEMYRTRESGRIVVASTDAIPFADASFDLVTSFDVVCQLPRPGDEKALAELSRVLKPGGGFVLRVPAFQFLHGPHDVVLHTQHRYSAREVEDMLRRAGMTPVKVTYANTLLFPVALGRRILSKALSRSEPKESDVRPVPGLVNRVLTGVLSAEGAVLERASLPFGLSVIAIARKP